jgi:ATP-dependent helicase HrpA
MPPFLKHNLLKLEEVERVEDKLRRRDLVVDEETIYQFYAERVPKKLPVAVVLKIGVQH